MWRWPARCWPGWGCVRTISCTRRCRGHRRRPSRTTSRGCRRRWVAARGGVTAPIGTGCWRCGPTGRSPSRPPRRSPNSPSRSRQGWWCVATPGAGAAPPSTSSPRCAACTDSRSRTGWSPRRTTPRPGWTSPADCPPPAAGWPMSGSPSSIRPPRRRAMTRPWMRCSCGFIPRPPPAAAVRSPCGPGTWIPISAWCCCEKKARPCAGNR
jgi:hypothetical protein